MPDNNFTIDLDDGRELKVQASHNHATCYVVQTTKRDVRCLLNWMHEAGWVFVTHYDGNFVFRNAIS
jgi:sRNA-binding protein